VTDPWQFPAQLARMPEVWPRLLELHRADPSGRCRGCTSQVGPAPRWPCVLYSAAARARRIASAG
jgi:hypothetical protein